MNQPTNSGGVDAAQVRGWFEQTIKNRLIPTEDMVEILTLAINQRINNRANVEFDKQNEDLFKNARQMLRSATPKAKGLRLELKNIEEEILSTCGEPASQVLLSVSPLCAALEAFLAEHRPRKEGRPVRPFVIYLIAGYGKIVAEVLRSAGWKSVSLTRRGSVVPAILSLMARDVANVDIRPDAFAEVFRAAKGGRKTTFGSFLTY